MTPACRRRDWALLPKATTIALGKLLSCRIRKRLAQSRSTSFGAPAPSCTAEQRTESVNQVRFILSAKDSPGQNKSKILR